MDGFIVMNTRTLTADRLPIAAHLAYVVAADRIYGEYARAA